MTVPRHAPHDDNAEDADYCFEGFSSPNTTSVPDEFFDVLAPRLSEAELRVALYILRRTFGFKKESDAISLKQMVEGITTKDGRILDRGTGMSRPGVTKGVRGLEAKGIIVTTHNSSKTRGYEATTYTLRFRSDPIATTLRRASQPRYEGHGNDVTIQETVIQETEEQGRFESSNDRPKKNDVDNVGITSYLDRVIEDFSREFKDTDHTPSNRQQARNLFAKTGLGEEDFVEQKVYPARAATRLQTGVGNRAAYFFAVLRDLCGEEKEASTRRTTLPVTPNHRDDADSVARKW